MTIPQTAELLRVSERTVHNWEAGRVRIPYAAYKLIRILRGYELPGPQWKGYRLVGDTLWSPENLPFKAADARWWSLTVAMAHEFRYQAKARRAKRTAENGALATVENGRFAPLLTKSASTAYISIPQQSQPATFDLDSAKSTPPPDGVRSLHILKNQQTSAFQQGDCINSIFPLLSKSGGIVHIPSPYLLQSITFVLHSAKSTPPPEEVRSFAFYTPSSNTGCISRINPPFIFAGGAP
jgi:hypothetical protein